MMDDQPTPEATRRDGIHALPVLMADGRGWGLAMPSTRLRPEVVEGVDELGRPTRSIQVVAEFGYPPEIRRLVDVLRSELDDVQRYDAFFALALALLRRAHDLDLRDAASLLEVDVDDMARFVEVVLLIVSGECLEDPGPPRKDQADG